MGLPRTQASPFDNAKRSVASPKAPCYGLRPRWTHITSQCPRAPCYIPRPEIQTNGGVDAAFRHTDNVGFQNHQNFGAYNQHPSLWPGIPSPQLHISLLPGRVWGSVLRWWLTFPQAGFSPAGEYEFISARLCSLCPMWLNPVVFTACVGSIRPQHKSLGFQTVPSR